MNREEYTNDDRRKGVQVAGPGVERSGTMAGARPGVAGPGRTNSAMIHIPLEDDIDRQALFGSMDANLQLIREATGVDIIQRDDGLTLKGPARHMQDARKILEELETMIRKGEKIDSQKLHYVIALESEGVSYGEHNVSGDTIAFTCQGRPIKPKTIGQKRYVNSIRKRDVVFAIGPAGTGKTYLAVAMAVRAMKNKEVQKIILARPAVEAGENLGFLPGDLQDKVDPYLRPLYDALYDMLGREKALALKEKEIIEVVPLAYMRGRTLDDAFIILDEAQNTTREQMKMFLTRMGFGSKIVVTGDVTQIDLPKGRRSGLVEAEKILKDVKGIDFCYLKGVDVVRHEMVKRIISAYDEYYKNHPDSRSDSGARRRNGQK
ncbi:PhoH family protein [Eubacterium pyruvativorans]|uniref:PhoH family protein n=2 Tax=Eubacterium pyruvativorans TaxID=155865 RepID=UPI003C6D84C8